jgi:hypothetical protein
MMGINYRKMISILMLAFNFNAIVVQVFSTPKLCRLLLNSSLMTFIWISI